MTQSNVVAGLPALRSDIVARARLITDRANCLLVRQREFLPQAYPAAGNSVASFIEPFANFLLEGCHGSYTTRFYEECWH
jgi:hypothetical protein